MIKLDILSDPICPWCFIGKTNLDTALRARSDQPFVIEWHPFQLNPTMGADGMGRRQYLEQKFGGKKGAMDVYGRIDEAARAVGLEINWDGITKTPNTLNAHRLIHWAGIEGYQYPLVAGLFDGYFMQGRDIGDIDTLVAIAEECGMEANSTRALLESDSDRTPLQEREKHSREMGVNSVPTFIVANQAVVQGAQTADFWTEVLDDFDKEMSSE